MAEQPRLLTDAELAAIAERADKATPGSWCDEGGSLTDMNADRTPSFTMEFIDNRRVSKEQRDADLAFMAASREDIPRLLADLRRYREWCRQFIQHLCANHHAGTTSLVLAPIEKAEKLAQEVRAALEEAQR